jgi:cytochrome c biogenesis protein CcmG/thiol:disulfide interchange protein DsbE
MRKVRFAVQLFRAFLAVALVCASGFAQEPSTPKIAPSFRLVTIEGKQIDLSEQRGKVVLLDFWATWCVPCQTEVPRFVAFQNQFAKDGFQMIGISMDDSPEPVKKFCSKFKVNYPVAMGTEELAKTYGGVLGLPLTFLIGRDGRIVKQYDGSADLDAMEREIRKLLETPTK